MEYIYVGKFVNTHGVRGEIRIVSEVPYKKEIFQPGIHLYIGQDKKEFEIQTYRPHKIYDMVLCKGVSNIDQMLPYKGDSVFVKKDEIVYDDYFYEGLIGLTVVSSDQEIGTIKNILKSKAHDILVVKGSKKRTLIPYIDHFIKEVNLDQKKMFVMNVEGLIEDED